MSDEDAFESKWEVNGRWPTIRRILLAVFVIYPVSSGPVCALAELLGWRWLAAAYWPLIWVTGFVPPLRGLLVLWLIIWSPRHGRGMIG